MVQVKRKLPEWFKVSAPTSNNFHELKNRLKNAKLNTVCEEAACPNIGECWDKKTATFMILGDICTRACRYCAVKSGKPIGLDIKEPLRVSDPAKKAFRISRGIILPTGTVSQCLYPVTGNSQGSPHPQNSESDSGSTTSGGKTHTYSRWRCWMGTLW